MVPVCGVTLSLSTQDKLTTVGIKPSASVGMLSQYFRERSTSYAFRSVRVRGISKLSL